MYRLNHGFLTSLLQARPGLHSSSLSDSSQESHGFGPGMLVAGFYCFCFKYITNWCSLSLLSSVVRKALQQVIFFVVVQFTQSEDSMEEDRHIALSCCKSPP